MIVPRTFMARRCFTFGLRSVTDRAFFARDLGAADLFRSAANQKGMTGQAVIFVPTGTLGSAHVGTKGNACTFFFACLIVILSC